MAVAYKVAGGTVRQLGNIIGYHWKQTKDSPITLECEMRYSHGAITMTGMREEMMVEIADWCNKNNCGRRMSYNQFQFKNKKSVTMFLLRWG
jgi:hypothetical protein